MKINGDLTKFIDCIGLKEGDSNILKMISIIGVEFEIEEINFADFQQVNYLFLKRGVDFVFDNHKYLESIFFYINQNERVYYPFLSELINGFNYKYKKNNIIIMFGKPYEEGKDWVKYKIKDKYIHFEFNASGFIKLISIFGE